MFDGKRILGFIPARSGSKGVPGKNLKLLHGKPLLGYTAEAALKSAYLDMVLLSTDSEQYAEAGRAMGLHVPFLRPTELAQDTTPTLPVIQHALRALADSGEVFDAVCLLQVTAPFRKKGFIDEAIEKFCTHGADSLLSVLPVPHEFNPHWTFETDAATGLLRIATGEAEIIKRRQDLPKAFFRDGSIYLTKTSVLLEKNSVYGESVAFVESDSRFQCNIDTAADWEKAERLVADILPFL